MLLVAQTRGRVTTWRPELSARLRCAIAVLSLVGAALADAWPLVLPGVVAVVVLELLADRYARLRVPTLVATSVVVVAVCVAVLSWTPMALPLLLVPSYRAGEQHGGRVALVVSLAVGAGPAAAAVVSATWVEPTLQWWALSVLLGQLGAWGARVEDDRRRSTDRAAREAGELLGRLRDLALRLPSGFDVQAVSAALLERATRPGEGPRAERGAVLVRVDDESVTPVALSGVDRVPWRDPVTAPGTAHDAWVRREPVHRVRPPDREGRRQGSAMLAVPLADRDDEVVGLLVLERLTPLAMSQDEIDHVVDTCRRTVPQLHAALAFTALRHTAEVAERERLAREMHDGVAQDLSALGFAVDVALKRVRDRDEEAARVLREVRAELNRTVGDIRMSIADLRSSPRPERGLGAALTSHVQALGSGGDLEVTFTLRESSFRLASHVEVVLLRLVLDLLQHTRSAPGVRALEVELESQPPHACVRLVRTGGGPWRPPDGLVAALAEVGGTVALEQEDDRLGVLIEVGAARDGVVDVRVPTVGAARLAGSQEVAP